MTSEDLALASAKGYGEFFNDRIGGASKRIITAVVRLCAGQIRHNTEDRRTVKTQE